MSTGAEVVALTGTIGAGKTTLAEAMSMVLHERGVRHALLDLDWLGQVYPVPDGHDPYGYELALDNLKQIWPNFVAQGASKAIVAGTLLNTDHRERLQDALGNADLTVVLVTARHEIRVARIRERDRGDLQADFLDRTESVANEIRRADIHDIEVTNEEGNIEETAVALLRKLSWIE